MIPFLLCCFDLSVTAECAEALLSISTINKCKDDFQIDSAAGLAAVFLYPRLWGSGERETRDRDRERGVQVLVLEGCEFFRVITLLKL